MSHVSIAREFLSIPSPSALVKRLFSVAGKVFTPKRHADWRKNNMSNLCSLDEQLKILFQLHVRYEIWNFVCTYRLWHIPLCILKSSVLKYVKTGTCTLLKYSFKKGRNTYICTYTNFRSKPGSQHDAGATSITSIMSVKGKSIFYQSNCIPDV